MIDTIIYIFKLFFFLILSLLPNSCVTLGKLPNLPGLQLLFCKIVIMKVLNSYKILEYICAHKHKHAYYKPPHLYAFLFSSFLHLGAYTLS